MSTITVATTRHEQAASAARETMQIELARLTLALAVPIEIAHLQHQEGGPYDYQIEAAQKYIAQQALGESVIFASKSTANEMRILCEVVAIMAFCPGGVNVLELHFEAEPAQ